MDDKSALTPGLTVRHPFQNAISYFKYGENVTSPQSYSTVFGLQASADATRQEQIAYTYNIRKLVESMPMPQDRSCSHISNVFIYSDLKIRDFIVNRVYLSYVPGLVYGKGVPFSTFSGTITFVVILGGSVTPIWKFVNITGSSNTPFINAAQTRSDFVTVTISQPGTTMPGPHPQLSPEGEAINNAQLIGQAVSNAIRSQLLPAQ